MGWVWRDDEEGEINSLPPKARGGDISEYQKKRDESGRDGEACSTRKVMRSQCRTEEVEPGKFLRKCEKTEEVLRHCLGKPIEVVKSNKEYTEDDVTDMMTKGSSSILDKFEDGSGPFGFPGLRSDIEGIERHFLGGIERFFEAAEEMKSNFFNVSGDFYDENSSSSKHSRRSIPIEGFPQAKARRETPKEAEAGGGGGIDLSGLGTDV